MLPEGGEYYEHDVYPMGPEGRNPLERIVYDIRSGRAWYTADHYGQEAVDGAESFIEMIDQSDVVQAVDEVL